MRCGTRILRVIHGRDARATSKHRLKSVPQIVVLCCFAPLRLGENLI